MLKVKLNINEEEIFTPEYISFETIQWNNGKIIFPFYDNKIAQFIELKKEGDCYNLIPLEGVINDDEIITNIKELDKKYIYEAFECFICNCNGIIEEYDRESFKNLIISTIESPWYTDTSIEFNEDKSKVYLKIDTLGPIKLIYDVYIGPYGTLTGHGRIIDIETNAIIIDNVYIHFNDFIVDENISMDEIEDIFNSIDDSYLNTTIINGLEKL